jgi:hypothetical protein
MRGDKENVKKDEEGYKKNHENDSIFDFYTLLRKGQ